MIKKIALAAMLSVGLGGCTVHTHSYHPPVVYHHPRPVYVPPPRVVYVPPPRVVYVPPPRTVYVVPSPYVRHHHYHHHRYRPY